MEETISAGDLLLGAEAIMALINELTGNQASRPVIYHRLARGEIPCDKIAAKRLQPG
jgi:hypothetical protein